MCGIVGIYDGSGKPIAQEHIERMTALLAHRGPDDKGELFKEHLAFGHCRLSIIDLSAKARQPLSNEDDTLWLIANGEVYNYIELREELRAEGHKFKTDTDSEVILHAYEEWGADCVREFNGMFAFALWDDARKKLFCARDRFGIKPFYYYRDGERFIFASELKAILTYPGVERVPNDEIIADFLVGKYGITDHKEDTFFVGIKKLLPAHTLTVAEDEFELTRYWALKNDKQALSDEQAVERFRELFEDAVRLRLRSDVPVGTCLSGGLDSSSIVCTMSKLLAESGEVDHEPQTFSSCFEDERFDERRYIQLVLDATGAKGNCVFPEGDKVFELLDALIWHQEEPFVGLTVLAQWHVMKLAKEHDIKVLLDGQGGDEVLGGYDHCVGAYFAKLLRELRLRRLISEINHYRRYHTLAELKNVALHTLRRLLPGLERLGAITYSKRWVDARFLKTHLRLSKARTIFHDIYDDHLYNLLTLTNLPALLRYEDKNSMAFSIEARVPLLDHRLVEFVFSLQPHQKMENGITKSILREAMQGTLPGDIRNRMDKMGFVTPEDVWYRTILKDEVWDIIRSESFRQRKYFNAKGITDGFERYCAGKMNLGRIIAKCIMLELWLRRFIDPVQFTPHTEAKATLRAGTT